MVVVHRFLHEIGAGPKYGKNGQSKSVAEPGGNEKSGNSHNSVIKIHAVSR